MSGLEVEVEGGAAPAEAPAAPAVEPPLEEQPDIERRTIEAPAPAPAPAAEPEPEREHPFEEFMASEETPEPILVVETVPPPRGSSFMFGWFVGAGTVAFAVLAFADQLAEKVTARIFGKPEEER